jgi:hypothetical protein
MERLFQLYKQVLIAHIQTKTVEPLFHEKSQDFYELLFDVFHSVSEKKQDIELDQPADCETAVNTTYDALIETKGILKDMIRNNDSIGIDNLLRGLYDKLESACGTARGFVKEEQEETEVDTTEEETEPVDNTEEEMQEEDEMIEIVPVEHKNTMYYGDDQSESSDTEPFYDSVPKLNNLKSTAVSFSTQSNYKKIVGDSLYTTKMSVGVDKSSMKGTDHLTPETKKTNAGNNILPKYNQQEGNDHLTARKLFLKRK